jgi:hypothetical protein
LCLARISATRDRHGSAHEERTSGRQHQPPFLFPDEVDPLLASTSPIKAKGPACGPGLPLLSD